LFAVLFFFFPLSCSPRFIDSYKQGPADSLKK
jgi:hypothetical protein